MLSIQLLLTISVFITVSSAQLFGFGTSCSTEPLEYCDMVNYPYIDIPILKLFGVSIDDYMQENFGSLSADFEDSQECLDAFKAWICLLTFVPCDYEEAPICTSMCIDFTQKCGGFWGTSTLCLDNDFYASDNCLEVLMDPPLQCSVPNLHPDHACKAVVDWPVPHLPSQDYEFDLVNFIYASYAVTVNLHVFYDEVTPQLAEQCLDAIRYYMCRVYVPECDIDPYAYVPPCQLDCTTVEDACGPFLTDSLFQGGECVTGLPTLECNENSPERWTWTFGDPHLATLDGHNYEFNGYGEYYLVQSTTGFLTAQLRFEPCGTAGNATCTTGFAMKYNGDILSLYSTGNTITVRDSTSVITGFPHTVGSITIVKDSDGYTITAGSASFKYMVENTFTTVLLKMTPEYHGLIRGLAGQFDNNPLNDFITPNGTVYPIAMNDSSIYEWGNTWRVEEADSLFYYASGKSWSDFNNLDFVPMFRDNVTITDEAKTVCAGIVGRFYSTCLFDVSVSGESTFVEGSKSAGNVIDQLPRPFAAILSHPLNDSYGLLFSSILLIVLLVLH